MTATQTLLILLATKLVCVLMATRTLIAIEIGTVEVTPATLPVLLVPCKTNKCCQSSAVECHKPLAKKTPDYA